MNPRPARNAFAIAIAFLLLLPACVAHAADAAEQSGAALQKLAEQKFGPLSRAEQLMLRGATGRDLVWLGPNNDPKSPENDLTQADKWRPERTVRAEVIRWLASDPEAVRYVHPSGPGFTGARIAGTVDLSYLEVPKPITMLRCYIPGGVDLSNAHLQSIDLRRSVTGPINGDSAQIDGDATMLLGHYGPISLFRARIAGNLDFIGAHVSNPGQDSISAMEATVGGDASFHEGFTTDGVVNFEFAKIGHSLSFNDAHFEGDGDNGLNAERATVAGLLYWVNITHTARTILDLSNASAGGLGDDAASWPAQGNLDVDGFVYGSIVDGPTDADSRLRWLALQTPGYKPQPYQQLARVLATDGNDSGATDVLIAQREAQRRFGNLSRSERWWNMMLEVTIGYGFRPLRAIWWMMAFVLLGAALFGTGYRLRIVTPTEADAYNRFVETGVAPSHYPPFNALVYSLENFLPVVELHQGQYWRPNPRHSARGKIRTGQDDFDPGVIPSTLLRWYLWVHILAGWTLTPLLFVGLSGLIRPD
ncbi:MAG TPA: hypothetical protein VJX23_05625 [Candidatus Binataceae bacterium]|nr:hypothetical protein [Candidatus Binataceae bacterium]